MTTRRPALLDVSVPSSLAPERDDAPDGEVRAGHDGDRGGPDGLRGRSCTGAPALGSRPTSRWALAPADPARAVDGVAADRGGVADPPGGVDTTHVHPLAAIVSQAARRSACGAQLPLGAAADEQRVYARPGANQPAPEALESVLRDQCGWQPTRAGARHQTSNRRAVAIASPTASGTVAKRHPSGARRCGRASHVSAGVESAVAVVVGRPWPARVLVQRAAMPRGEQTAKVRVVVLAHLRNALRYEEEHRVATGRSVRREPIGRRACRRRKSSAPRSGARSRRSLRVRADGVQCPILAPAGDVEDARAGGVETDGAAHDVRDGVDEHLGSLAPILLVSDAKGVSALMDEHPHLGVLGEARVDDDLLRRASHQPSAAPSRGRIVTL